MKSKFLLLSVAAISVSSQIALANMENQAVQENSTQNVQAQNSQNTNETALLGWLVILDKNEVAVSKEVLTHKILNPLVKAYAQFMVKQHSLLLQDTMRVSKKLKMTPDESADKAAALKKEGDDLLEKLKGLDDKSLNKAYIDAMVQGHTEALAALAEDIKTEKNPAIKALLKDTETHVKLHLQKAKEVQKKIGA